MRCALPISVPEVFWSQIVPAPLRYRTPQLCTRPREWQIRGGLKEVELDCSTGTEERPTLAAFDLTWAAPGYRR